MKRILLIVLALLCSGCAVQPKVQPQKQVRVIVIDPDINTYGNVRGITKPGSTELDRVEVTFGVNANW